MPNIKLATGATQYLHTYTDDNGFQARIILNARDAMVFGEIVSLPSSQQDIEPTVKEFLEIFNKQYGAKAVLTIDPALSAHIPDGVLKPGECDARYIDVPAATKAIELAKAKPHVSAQLNKFGSGEYKLLTNQDLLSRTKELNEFKIKYASFIDETKIRRGQYSQKAEEVKLNNPYVRHYAIEHNNKIIVSGMLVIHGDYIYTSDWIVDAAYRSKENQPGGLYQTFCAKILEDVCKQNPNTKGFWVIAGGHGKLTVGSHLYFNVLPSEYLREKLPLQKELGLYLMYGAPGKEFMLAANRDAQTSLVIGEDDNVNTALEILKESKQPALAAAQPMPPASKTTPMEQVTPISWFNKKEGTPISSTASTTPHQQGNYQPR